jgi:hypothetical protein
MTKNAKRLRDFSQAAKLVIDVATRHGENSKETPEKRARDPGAVERGRLGGRKGGRARAENMTPAERIAAARRAVAARWSKSRPPS